MSTKLTIYFPKQPKDYKEANRIISRSKIFKEFIVERPKDRRYLHFDFKTEEKYNVMKPILFNNLHKLDYDVDEVTE